jgi:hypothetical protein
LKPSDPDDPILIMATPILIIIILLATPILIMADRQSLPKVGDIYSSTKDFSTRSTLFFAKNGKGCTMKQESFVKPGKKKPYKRTVQCTGCRDYIEGTMFDRVKKLWKISDMSDMQHINCFAPSAPKLKMPSLLEDKSLIATAAICAQAGKRSKSGSQGLISWASANNNGLDLSRDQAIRLMRETKKMAKLNVDDQYSLVRDLFAQIEKLNSAGSCRTIFKTDAQGRFETCGIVLPLHMVQQSLQPRDGSRQLPKQIVHIDALSVCRVHQNPRDDPDKTMKKDEESSIVSRIKSSRISTFMANLHVV